VMTSEPCQTTPKEVPSRGSIRHFTRQCKPCAFVNTKGCRSGSECQFCHLCAPGEKKQRKREKRKMHHHKCILAGSDYWTLDDYLHSIIVGCEYDHSSELLARGGTDGDTIEKFEFSATDGALSLTFDQASEDQPTDSISSNMHLAVTTSKPCQFTPTELPTRGSLGHFTGQCKPCVFVNTKGCRSGYECQFCHLCAPGEKKRRKRETYLYKHYLKHIRASWKYSSLSLDSPLLML